MNICRRAPRIHSKLVLTRTAPTRGRLPWTHQRKIHSSSSGTASSTGGPPSVTSVGMLAPFTTELDRIAPSVDIRGEQIRVLKEPSEFYEALKDRIRNAKSRVFLSTLYIGKTEQELIDTLATSLRNNPNLRVSVLTDALRGTREAPNPSCASLLAPLVSEFGSHRVEIRMYHTPNLTGLRKAWVPKRINEGWGLQHMKLYGVDDEIILSGANLSTDYFTNRQDRYHLISSREVTDFFARVHNAVGSLSFLVNPSASNPSGFDLVWPENNNCPSPLDSPEKFVSHATKVLDPIISPSRTAAPRPQTSNTRVYLLAQMSQLLRPDTSTELPALTHILRTLSSKSYAGSSWTFTAGYFNPDPSLTSLLLATSSTNNTVLTASPYANGFYRSPGVSGLLPDAYTLLARRFLRAVHASRRDDAITLKEWRRGTVGTPDGWTYHAKGLWLTLPHHANPSITLVGSSNYTRRSYSLDLEVGALVVTEDEKLRERLGDEKKWLQDHAEKVTIDDLAKNERRVGLKVRVAMGIVRLVGGAL